MRSMIAEAVAKELKTKKDSESSRKEAEQELHQYLVSLVEASTGKKAKNNANVSAAAIKQEEVTEEKPAAVTLANIMQRVQFKKQNK